MKKHGCFINGLLLIMLMLVIGCQYIPNDVKDFLAEPAHKEMVSECMNCHTQTFQTDAVCEGGAKGPYRPEK
jgi:hypothetical protein